jgi:hypothetical protein
MGIKVKDPVCGISRAIQVVSFQHMWWCPSKIKIQVSTIYPNASLCINEKHTFMEIDDKGGEIVQRYKSFGRD